MDQWGRLRRQLDGLAAQAATPPGGRLGAALVLLRDPGDGDLELTFTRRRDDLRSHPGQISFPGGRVDPGETPEQAAVREAHEEVGLDPAGVTVLGRLPAFYIPPSRFWLHAVLARWDTPHPLVPAESEVAEVLTTRMSKLADPVVWRAVELSAGGWTWAWQLDERHLLWGATAVVTSVVLGLLDPDWSGGVDPTKLGAERLVRPWEGAPGAHVQPRRLGGLPDLPLEVVSPLADGALRGLPALPQARDAGAAIVEALRRLGGGVAPERVLILIGPGGTGMVGAAAAGLLARADRAPTILATRDRGLLPPATRALLEGLPVRPPDSALPEADVVVDAVLGGGLDGRLRGGEAEAVLALRHHTVPVVSVDLPSGIHPERGLVGESVTADVTIALEGPRPGLLRPGLEPFAGDLYLASLQPRTAVPLLRLVRGAAASGWRE